MGDVPITERAGLQIERTDMAWSRTSLSFAVNGGLLIIHQNMPGPAWLYYVALVLAFGLFVFTYGMARRRARVFEQRPLPEPLADTAGITILAAGTLCLGVVVVGVVLMA